MEGSYTGGYTMLVTHGLTGFSIQHFSTLLTPFYNTLMESVEGSHTGGYTMLVTHGWTGFTIHKTHYTSPTKPYNILPFHEEFV